MKPKIDYLGKVSCTVSKDYWSSEKDYDKLTIVEKEGVFGTFISRKPVLAGTPLTNREFWIPFSSVKESIVLDYNSFKDKYDKQLNDYKISLSDVISRLKTLEESKTDIDDLTKIANTALYKANNALAAVANINNKLEKPNGIATLDSTGKVPLTQLPDNIGGGNNLELGETSTTAYPGDKGKTNANAIRSLTNALDSVDTYSRATRNQLDTFKNTKGQSQGIAPLDENGKVASSYLPSYVDDVLEYNTRTTFPTTGESGKIYIALDTNKTYRWGGTAYTELTSSITLGETSSTAYAGDKGKKNREDINNLKNGLDSLTNNLDEVNNKATTNTTAIEDLTTEVNSTNTEVNTINGKISKLNTTIGDVRSSFNNYASAKTPIIDKVEPHIANKQNPHEVTKAQVGLSNVTNDAQVKRSEMGANNGVATLDANGKVLESQLPAAVTYAANLPDNIVGGGKATTTENGIILSLDTKNKENGNVSSKDILIPNADGTKTDGSGLMLNSDKNKIDRLPTLIAYDFILSSVTSTEVKFVSYYKYITEGGKTQYTTITLNAATNSKAGVMTAADKVKLDSLSNYTLPIADSTTLGGIKIGSGLNIDSNGIVSVDNKLYILVNSLESVSTPDANKIYLVLNSSSTSETNSFTEYVWITSDTGSKWEKLGEASATVDLADYYTKTEINNKLSPINNSITELDNNKVNKQDVATTAKNGLLSKEDKTKLDGIEIGANKYVLPKAGYNVLGGIKATTKTAGNNPGMINGTEVNVVDGVAPITYERTAEYVGANYKIIREATTTKYGLMSPEDKVKLDNLSTGSSLIIGTTEGTAYDGAAGANNRADINRILQTYVYTPNKSINKSSTNITLSFQSGTIDGIATYGPDPVTPPSSNINIVIPSATTTSAGLMSASDKVKLDNLSSGGSSTITEYTEAEITTLLNQINF